MLRRCVCALAVLFLLVGFLGAATEYKGMLVALKEDESITVKFGGNTKTFKITAKTAFVRWQKEDGEVKAHRVRPAILEEKLAKAKKKGVPVEFTDFGLDGKTQIRAVYFDLHNKPKTKKEKTKKPTKDE